MATTEGRGAIEVDPGEQVLVSRDSISEPFEHLPDDALEGLVFVSTRGSPDAVEERVRRAGVAPGRVTVVPVSGSTIRYDGPIDVTERVGPNDLTAVGIRVTEALDGSADAPWLAVDNVNVFLMYAADDRVYRFLDTVAGKARSAGASGAYFSVTAALVEDTEAKLRQVVDRTIEGL